MNCELLSTLLYEGQITPEATAHLASCESCRELARRLSEIEPLLRFAVTPDEAFATFRKRLILQKTKATEQDPAHAAAWRFARISLAAALVLLVFVIPQHKSQMARNTVAGHEVPFELQKVNDQVKLSWNGDPSDEYRIYKGTTPAALKPVESVRGKQWIDRAPDSSPITFYRVEEL